MTPNKLVKAPIEVQARTDRHESNLERSSPRDQRQPAWQLTDAEFFASFSTLERKLNEESLNDTELADPLFPLVWDCFKLRNLFKVQDLLVAQDSQLFEMYADIRDRVDAMCPDRLPSEPREFFVGSQHILAVVRKAFKILHKERLAHVLAQLFEMNTKLRERKL